MNKKAILTMVVLTVLVLLFPGFVHGAIPTSEREALIALYKSTNGESIARKKVTSSERFARKWQSMK